MNVCYQRNSPYIDLVTCQLYRNMKELKQILETIENNHGYQDSYVPEAMKRLESELRRLRKFIINQN